MSNVLSGVELEPVETLFRPLKHVTATYAAVRWTLIHANTADTSETYHNTNLPLHHNFVGSLAAFTSSSAPQQSPHKSNPHQTPHRHEYYADARQPWEYTD